MVVVLGGRELLDQLGVALQWGEVERGELDVRCQMCSSSFCRRGVASSDAADSGRIDPFGVSMADVGGVPAAGGTLLRWNSESMANPG